MRAAILEQPGQPLAVYDDVEIADPRSGEVLVAVKHCGVCHSDVSMVDGSFPVALPVVLGHEAAGIVEAVGDGVTHLSVGDHVVLTPAAPCGVCPWCVRGEWSLCTNSDAMVTSAMPDGSQRLSRRGAVVHRGLAVAAFAEQVVIQATGAVKVPDDVPLEHACLVGCSVQTGVGAVLNTAGVSEGETVLIMGLGGVGQAAVQGAKVAGATRIIVSDPVAARRELAMSLGATHALDPTTDEVALAVADLTPGGIGVDYAFDAAGSSALISLGIDVTRKGGMTVMVGVPKLDDPLTLALPAALAVGEKKLVGSLLGSCNSLRDIPRIIELARTGQLDLGAMVTARRPLEEINTAIDDIQTTTGVRTVLDL